jgi:tetratricopeptide (TPR) repeat protein
LGWEASTKKVEAPNPEGWGQSRNQPFFVPNLGSATFVGRESELLELHALLQQSDRVAIVAATGMGGVGKTELAWQYAHRHRQDYGAGVWWIASQGIDWVSQVLAYGARIGLPVPPDTLEADVQKVQWVYDQWGHQCPQGLRLLVVDDLPGGKGYAALKAFWPQDPAVRVLATTRVQLGPPVQPLRLGVLSPEKSCELLQKLGVDGQRLEAESVQTQALVDWVGYLPLGVELVGRYLATYPNLRIATLLERLEAKKLEAMALRTVPPEMAYEDNIEAAFELSWQLLSDAAKTVGGVLGVMALAPVSQALLADCLPGWDREALEAVLDAEWVRNSLLSDLGEGQYLLHSLIHKFVAVKLDKELQLQAEAIRRGVAQGVAALAKTIQRTVTLAEQARVQVGIPHMAIIAESLTPLLEYQDVVFLFICIARVAESQSRWQEAEKWCLACRQMSEQRFGEDHPYTASSLNNLAGLYNLMGRYSEAEPLNARALSIYENQLCADHPMIALGLNNLAALYTSMGQYNQAEPLYVRSLSIREQQLGADHPDTAESLNNLAELYRLTGRYSDAEPLYVRSLFINEQQLGTDHPNIAFSLNNLAGLYKSMGRYGEAKPLYLQSLSICEKQLGLNHPNTALSLNSLAMLYDAMGCYQDAEPLLVRALAIREKVLGTKHPDTAQGMNDLAELYDSMGRYSEAEPLYVRALSIREQLLGSKHPDTATSMNNVAFLYHTTGRYREAEPLYLQALSIREQQLGADHPDTVSSLNNLAGLYYNTGRYNEAEPLYLQALSIRKQQLGADHPNTAQSLNNLAGLYSAMGRHRKAESLYVRSLSIREEQLGADHPDTAGSLNNLAGFYVSMKRYSEAEPLLARALEIFINALGHEHPHTQMVLDSFSVFVQIVHQAGRSHELSDHSFTQYCLQQLQSNLEED